MNIFANVGEKIKNFIFTEEFDQRFENATAKTTFVLYCCSGGFCFDSSVRTRFKIIWITFNAINFVLVYSSCLFYLFNVPVRDYMTLLYPAPTLAGLFTKVCIYVWFFRAREVFTKLFAFLNREKLNLGNSSRHVESEHDHNEGDYISLSINKIIVLALSFLVGVTIACTLMDLQRYFHFDDYYVQIYPTYVPFDKSGLLCRLIRFVQVISIMPELFILISLPLSLFISAVNIYNEFVSLSLFLRNASNLLGRSFDEIALVEMAMEEGRMRRSRTKIREMKIKKTLAEESFMCKVIVVIKQHQELYAMAKLYANEMKFLFSLAYFYFVSSCTLGVFFATTMIKTDDFYKSAPAVAIAILAMIFSWLLYSFMGELFPKMTWIIISEFYDSPWYHLKPANRRLIYTFLTIIQRPINLIACGIYQVNLSSSPDLLNTIYSQVKILRTLQMNKQKRSN